MLNQLRMTLPKLSAATPFVTGCHPLPVGRRVVPTRGSQENQRVTGLMARELRKSGHRSR